MEPDAETEKLQFVIPARTISGTAQDLLDELDDMVEALELVRKAIVARTPTPARPRRHGWLAGAWRSIARWRRKEP